MIESWNEIVSQPIASILIVLNLIVIESLLSIDNATVLAIMVRDLPLDQRDIALKYGIWGAYFFRGLALLFASKLMNIWWLKILGGLYLIYIFYDWWRGRQTQSTDDDVLEKDNHFMYQSILKYVGQFWATVALVEFMDIAFSIDNVFAAVAFTPNILLVCIGVFIGILAMRYVAYWFNHLIEKYPFLEVSAFIVILILGLKLMLSAVEHFYPESAIAKIISSESFEMILSAFTVLIFGIPLLTSRYFNYPSHQ